MSIVWRFHLIHMSPLSIFKPLFKPKLCRFFKRAVLYPFFSWFGVHNTIPYADVMSCGFCGLLRCLDCMTAILGFFITRQSYVWSRYPWKKNKSSEQSYKRSYCRFQTLHCINIVTRAVWSGIYGESPYITETEHSRFLTAHIVWSSRRPTHLHFKTLGSASEEDTNWFTN